MKLTQASIDQIQPYVDVDDAALYPSGDREEFWEKHRILPLTPKLVVALAVLADAIKSAQQGDEVD